MKVKKLPPVSNLYFVLVLIALVCLIFYILDSCIGKIQNNLEGKGNEHFDNLTPSELTPSELTPSLSTDNNLSPSMEEEVVEEEVNNNNNKLEDNSFMYEIENKDLVIGDFYPTHKVYSNKTSQEMLKFTEELDLFHQIIPKLDGGYLGTIWFDERIAGIYQTDDLTKKQWTKLDKDMPPNIVRPVFIMYDRDRMLLAIFEDKKGDTHLYKKECTSIDSEWLLVERTRLISLIYDSDDRLLGLDSKGNYYKKSQDILESEWDSLEVSFDHIPMRKLLFDYKTDIMLGIGLDFRIYKKRYSNWLESDWGEGTKKTLSGSIRDLFYDYDGMLVGLSRVGIVKKKEDYYLSDFKLYKNPENKEVSIYRITYAITGITNMAQYDDSGKNNNVYVDGKKISEYKFKDPRLNTYLDFRMKLKKQCRKVKGMKIIEDNDKDKQQERVRNHKFNRILNEQKNTIDSLMDTIQGLKDNSF